MPQDLEETITVRIKDLRTGKYLAEYPADGDEPNEAFVVVENVRRFDIHVKILPTFKKKRSKGVQISLQIDGGQDICEGFFVHDGADVYCIGELPHEADNKPGRWRLGILCFKIPPDHEEYGSYGRIDVTIRRGSLQPLRRPSPWTPPRLPSSPERIIFEPGTELWRKPIQYFKFTAIKEDNRNPIVFTFFYKPGKRPLEDQERLQSSPAKKAISFQPFSYETFMRIAEFTRTEQYGVPEKIENVEMSAVIGDRHDQYHWALDPYMERLYQFLQNGGNWEDVERYTEDAPDPMKPWISSSNRNIQENTGGPSNSQNAKNSPRIELQQHHRGELSSNVEEGEDYSTLPVRSELSDAARAVSAKPIGTFISNLSTREAVIDAIYRFAQGLDDNNSELIGSAFTADAAADFTGLNETGKSFSVITGRELIINEMVSGVGKLDTTHMITNIRVEINGKSAELSCYCLSQHSPLGEGSPARHSRCILMGHRYRARLVKLDRSDWRIQHLTVINSWSKGDIRVLGN